MQKENITEANGSISYDEIQKLTKNFTKPLVIRSYLTQNQIDVEELREASKNSSTDNIYFHTGSYWSENPIESEFQNNKKSSSIVDFFDEKNQNSGNYILINFKEKIKTSVRKETDAINLISYIHEKLPVKSVCKNSYASIIWLSLGNTKSYMHADPTNNLFIQLKGSKQIVVKEYSLKIIFKLRLLRPWVFKENAASIIESKSSLAQQFNKLVLNENDALFLPASCFHDVQSDENKLNISVSNLIVPSRWQKITNSFFFLNYFSRSIYPKIVKNKRRAFLTKIVNENSIPFFLPKQGIYVKKNIYAVTTDQYILKNDSSYKIINNLKLVKCLNEINGLNKISELPFGNEILPEISKLIKEGYLYIYNENMKSEYNYTNILYEK